MSILRFDNVSYQYPGEDFDIIDGLSFSVEPGSFHCIVGVSGCGKSTIFRMINGLLPPKAGTISVNGKPITAREHYCGYMPQKDMLFPWRTIGENLALPLEIQRGYTKAQQRDMIDAALADVGLDGCRDKRPDELSGGMRQRAAFARTMLTGSDLLLLDEPTNDLDIATLTILEDYLRSFQGAVLAISHDRYFLDKMASEIWELTGNGEVRRYNGNYQDYMEKALPENATEKPKKQTEKKERVFNGRKKLKFSFKEQREYDTIDDEIADLEEQIRLTETEITASVSDYVKLQELSDRKEELEVLLAEKMERWVYLNDLAERIANGEME